jgi:hypothetical protein
MENKMIPVKPTLGGEENALLIQIETNTTIGSQAEHDFSVINNDLSNMVAAHNAGNIVNEVAYGTLAEATMLQLVAQEQAAQINTQSFVETNTAAFSHDLGTVIVGVVDDAGLININLSPNFPIT